MKRRVRYPRVMKSLILSSAAALAALSLFSGAVQAAPSPAPVYNVAAVDNGLVHNAARWNGRVILVRGLIRIVAVGNLPTDPPGVVLVDNTSPQSIAYGLLLHQAPASHQHVNFGRATTYRVRVTRIVVHGRVGGVATIL
jgi:hypothetical protein